MLKQCDILTYNIFLNFIINPLIRIQLPSLQATILVRHCTFHHNNAWTSLISFSILNLAYISTDCLHKINFTIHDCRFTENSIPVLHFDNDNRSPHKTNLVIIGPVGTGLGTTPMQLLGCIK